MSLHNALEGASPGEWGRKRAAGALYPIPDTASQAKPPKSPVPADELFQPEHRRDLLHYLTQTQFPAIRDLVGRLLEGAYFLLDPAEVTFRVIQRMVVEADDYTPGSPYWDWARSVAVVAIHEIIEAAWEGRDEIPADSNHFLRQQFNELPLEQRRSLYLVGVMGYTLEEASRRAGENPEIIQSNARKGLRRLHESMLKKDQEKGEGHEGE